MTNLVNPAGGGGVCKITPTPADPCPFHATAGPVTLTLIDVVGTVDFVSAKLNGQPIAVSPKTITFTLVAGTNTLEIACLFSDTVNGRGELREVCGASPLLADFLAGNPAQILTICV
jgi:hypothetical protein